jgi:putative ABC transport system permease protein
MTTTATRREDTTMQSDVGWSGLAISLVLVAIALLISWWRGLRLATDMLVAVVRATAQLVAVGYVLVAILDEDQPVVIALAWVAAMVGVAAWTVQRRAREVPHLFSLAAVAIGLSTTVTLGVTFGLGIFPFEARAVVPVGGMIVGNALAGVVVAARRILAELRDKRLQIEARLALGQPWHEAAQPQLRAALRTALIPTIESTKAVGLISLPGTMTGLILAGVDPLDAVLVQAAVMFLILGSVAVNVVVIGLGLTRRLFTPDHRLLRIPAAA